VTLAEFIEREMRESGKRVFLRGDVIALTEKWIAEKKATVDPFAGWVQPVDTQEKEA
jgi:hypothetical protein